MNEIDRLKMQVEHYENKEYKLIEYLEKEIKACDEAKSVTDDYNLKMNWIFYQRALIRVLKEINKLERVENER